MNWFETRRRMLLSAIDTVINPLYIYQAGDTAWNNVLEVSSTGTITGNSSGGTLTRTFGTENVLIKVADWFGYMPYPDICLKVDFTNYNHLYIDCEGDGEVGYLKEITGTHDENYISKDVTTRQEIHFSISGEDAVGEHYIRLRPSTSDSLTGGYPPLYVNEIRLEV